ncbi:MAG: hypothetical protein HeimC3_00070 [Candidatus Heimdallarchaeota archaeon LC_3]|nr:MAG: hypothetical protein HeimC3_50320 [Candidatus Heimdallarchaeota archaeon LC_3]OLS28048.1 MAG: hypothetical protein HeimC3_00070 [Candidatus Heimdallarchaeota archaeon LC_3]
MTKFIGKKSVDDSKDKQSQIALIIEEILKESREPLKSEEIVIKTGLSLRSVRYGMKLLMESEKITKYPDLRDLRSFYYTLQ